MPIYEWIRIALTSSTFFIGKFGLIEMIKYFEKKQQQFRLIGGSIDIVIDGCTNKELIIYQY